MAPEFLAVISSQGELLALCTSGVDAWLKCKPVEGARVWRCSPNSDEAEVVAQSRGAGSSTSASAAASAPSA